MPATESFFQNPLVGPQAATRLAERIRGLGREIPGAHRARLLELLAAAQEHGVGEVGTQQDASGADPAADRADASGAEDRRALSHDELRDVLSTRLMEVFRDNRSRGCFGLLYELNGGHLVAQVASRLRRYSSKSDPHDVLQEVFFNIYRYPHRFDATRDDAFRVWSAMIVRNTVLKHLRSLGRGGRHEVPFEDLSDQPVDGDQNPLTGVLREEESRACSRTYVTYLQLYLTFYGMLSERERRALHLVEVDRISYRDAAAELGIKLENLKMVIFRARRKIHRAMRRTFEGLPPDCRPARDPGLDAASGALPRAAAGRFGRRRPADRGTIEPSTSAAPGTASESARDGEEPPR